MKFWRDPAFHSLSLLLFCLLSVSTASAETLVIGSKKFPESYVLAEIAKRQLENAGVKDVRHQLGLGATGIVWGKLHNGEIAIYPEYNATVSQEILKLKGEVGDDQIREALKQEGIGM